jgi:branched-chain amino acid transport system ATP-binding protein
MSEILQIEGVFAGYGGGDILRGMDLRLEQGTITCIVGPNGAGKSTVMRVVSGVLHPRRGEVRFMGQRIDQMTPKQILQSGIVQVPQNRSLFPAMTVEENVRLGGYTLQDRALVEQRLAEVGEQFPIVRERAKDKAGSLSGGQQKLVEFARGLMLDPKLVLLDEPSMGLEPRILDQVFGTMIEMCKAGRTILLVEQNARQGLESSDRGVVMESGRVLLDGPAKAVLSDERIGDLYLGGHVH